MVVEPEVEIPLEYEDEAAMIREIQREYAPQHPQQQPGDGVIPNQEEIAAMVEEQTHIAEVLPSIRQEH